MSADPEDRTEAIMNQIRVWAGQTDFEAHRAVDVDRTLAEFDLRAEIDSSLSASANWEIVKDKLNLQTKTDFEAMMRGLDEQEAEVVQQEIQDQFDTYGAEAVVDAITGIGTVPDDLQQRVDDVLAEFPPDAYDTVLVNRVGALFDALGSDFQVISEPRLDRLREEAETGGVDEAEVRANILQRLERSFGQRFDDIDDAIRSLRQRVERARGQRLRIAAIEARAVGGELRVRIEKDGDFLPYKQPARRRVERELDLSELGSTWTTVGEVRLRADELEAIDLEIGREQLGSVAEPQPIPEEQRDAGEQVELEATTATAIADEFIDLGEGT